MLRKLAEVEAGPESEHWVTMPERQYEKSIETKDVILKALDKRGAMTTADLCELLGKERGSVVRQIEILRNYGYISATQETIRGHRTWIIGKSIEDIAELVRASRVKR